MAITYKLACILVFQGINPTYCKYFAHQCNYIIPNKVLVCCQMGYGTCKDSYGKHVAKMFRKVSFSINSRFKLTGSLMDKEAVCMCLLSIRPVKPLTAKAKVVLS